MTALSFPESPDVLVAWLALGFSPFSVATSCALLGDAQIHLPTSGLSSITAEGSATVAGEKAFLLRPGSTRSDKLAHSYLNYLIE